MVEVRLSDAILLGSRVIPSQPITMGYSGGPGCALGMACAATGLDVGCNARESDLLKDRFPVLDTEIWLPCGCSDRNFKVFGVIGHIFDFHVMDKHNWTIEQLVDWVRTIEDTYIGTPKREIYVEPLELPEPLRVDRPAEEPLPSRVERPEEVPEKVGVRG